MSQALDTPHSYSFRDMALVALVENASHTKIVEVMLENKK